MIGQDKMPGEDSDSGDTVVERRRQAEDDRVQEQQILANRKTLKAKMTRSMNRISEAAQNIEVVGERRLNKLLAEVRSDFSRLNDMHSSLYDICPTEHSKLERWEKDLADSLYEFEEEIEDKLAAYKRATSSGTGNKGSKTPRVDDQTRSMTGENRGNNVYVVDPEDETLPRQTTRSTMFSSSAGNSNQSYVNSQTEHSQYRQWNPSRENSWRSTLPPWGAASEPEWHERDFDSWIDELSEYQMTIPRREEDISIAEALYRLEASKDMPQIKLCQFDGDPTKYVEFVESFKLHIHDKKYLNNDIKMLQLKMHVSGNAERAVAGLGSGGVMYPTALKLLKEQFGDRGQIARAIISKIVKGPKLSPSNRQGLRDLSLDMINCLATLKRLRYFADINSTESLRQTVRRLPDHMIVKWKNRAADLRDCGVHPTLEHISSFLRRQVRVCFDPDFGDLEDGSDRFDHKGAARDKRKSVSAVQAQPEHTPDPPVREKKILRCYQCNEAHKVSECPTFVDSTVAERYKIAKERRLCYCCLNKGHGAKECRSKKQCIKEGCDKTHHPLLHVDPPSSGSVTSTLDREGILPVVRVKFRASNGRSREGNVLIDGGAATTVIRKEFSKALGLQGKREPLEVSVVGCQRFGHNDSRRVKFWVSSLAGGKEYEVEAHEISQTVTSVPPLDREWLSSFEHLRDLDLSHKAGAVDLILGVQYSHLHVAQETRSGPDFEPAGILSKLGWYVLGPGNCRPPTVSIGFVKKIDVQNLYDMEGLGVRAPNCKCPVEIISREDKATLEMFQASCHKMQDRYEVGLPWKKNPDLLPNNQSLAENRLFSLERRLQRDPQKSELYREAMKQYIDNGWAVELTPSERVNTELPEHYLPHHGVYRPDKPSTPLRIVFNPASLFKGTSLNSFLYKGPCLIGDLLGVLLRFRERPVAFIGDISKMFLQILLPERDSHTHRFLWRDMELTKSPSVFRLTRVTFGDKPSPAMASFVILEIAKAFEKKFPEAAKILRHGRYVDDIIHSCDTDQQSVELMSALEEMLASGSFKIKEWISTSNTKGTSSDVNIDGQDSVKTLGVCWKPSTDMLHFQVQDVKETNLTKRIVLSKLSMMYDPLGLAAALIIRTRIEMQNIWKLGIGWDDPLPSEFTDRWKQLFTEMKELEKIKIPRCINKEMDQEAEMHVFTDASLTAYGAVAYLRTQGASGTNVKLIAAKARVAPLHQTTVPRLELMAAIVGSRLAKSVEEELRMDLTTTLWTDSKIVLCWLKTESLNLKQFVGVRVAEIQESWESTNWRYVPTDDNPADDLSRGLKAVDLGGRWLNGPEFLKRPKNEWPAQIETHQAPLDEVKPKVVLCTTERLTSISLKFSNWKRLLRVTAWCRRFIHNTRYKTDRSCGVITATEIADAEKHWILIAQEELHDWKKEYLELAPFEEDGIIRVGGRLRHAELSYDQTHPVLLKGSSHISKLIMKEIHAKTHHPGAGRTLCESRRKYWITRGRDLAKNVVRNCTVCRKLRQPPQTTLMADIPKDRLRSFSPPFSTTGVDLFGPFNLKQSRNKTSKAWGAIFTCGTVRAIHLEIVEDLSTQAFLQAIRRFASHHGWPKLIISDNGTSFVGAEKELRKLVQEERRSLQEFATSHSVDWKFITPLSPNQGGFYETLIKQVKTAMKVIVGQQTMTWNEMATVFAEIKSLMNSRPIGYSSDDPEDLQPLTPNHFLLGRATADVPHGPFQETKNLHKRFEFLQGLVKNIWDRFTKEYLPTLMRRSKWKTKNRQTKVGDIVLLTDDNIPRGKWNLARVIEVYPGQDGVIRNVKVKTAKGIYKRSIQRCCLILEETPSTVGPEDDVK